MIDGWVKLHRQFIKWEWYDDANVVRLFLHCLLLANFEDKNWRGETIKRGSFISSYNKLGLALNLSVQQVRTAFSKLAQTGEIKLQTTNKYTTVIVCNYDTYQDVKNKNNNQITNKEQSNNNQITTTKKDNNSKKEKKIYSDLISDYESLKKMEEPLTQEQEQKLLDEYPKGLIDTTLLAMENWKGIEKKNKSVYLTCRTWMNREMKKNKEEPKPQYLTNKL